MIKIAMIGIMAVFLAMFLKRDRQEFGILVILTGCLLILFLSVEKIRVVLDGINRLKLALGDGSTYVEILLKMLGITYVAEFSANLCKDAGFGAIANQIEFYGKVMLIAVSIPILFSLIETIGQI